MSVEPASVCARLSYDVVRHDFTLIESHVLLVVLLAAGGGNEVVMDRKEITRRTGFRTDKVLAACRKLERCRVLVKGWFDGRFVIVPNCDLWKKPVRKDAGGDADVPLGLESGDDGERFSQEVARQNFSNLARNGVGGLPTRSSAEMNDGRPGGLPGDGVVQFPEMGKPEIPQNGEGVRGGPADGGLRALPVLGSNVTLERLSVSTFERINVERLQERIRRFVGETDFDWNWHPRKAPYLWNDPVRLRHMEETVAMALAGFASGELKVRTTPGKALWSHVKSRWEAFQMERARV